MLTPGTGRVLTFATVTGSVSYNDVDAPPTYLGQYNGPDGGAVNFQDASWPNNYLTTSGTPGLLSPQLDDLAKREHDRRERAWSPAARWRAIQETIRWAEAQVGARRNTARACIEQERRRQQR